MEGASEIWSDLGNCHAEDGAGEVEGQGSCSAKKRVRPEGLLWKEEASTSISGDSARPRLETASHCADCGARHTHEAFRILCLKLHLHEQGLKALTSAVFESSEFSSFSEAELKDYRNAVSAVAELAGFETPPFRRSVLAELLLQGGGREEDWQPHYKAELVVKKERPLHLQAESGVWACEFKSAENANLIQQPSSCCRCISPLFTVFEAAKKLHESSWRRLHSGHWASVPLCFREAFSCACLFLSLFYGAASKASLQSKASVAECWKLAFRYLDLGLIMGGPAVSAYAFLLSMVQVLEEMPRPCACEESPRTEADPRVEAFPIGAGDPLQAGLVPVLRKRRFVEEATHLTLEQFIVQVLPKAQPLLLRGAEKGLPCVSLWRDWNVLKRRLGHRLVPVEIGDTYTSKSWTQRLLLFEEFVEQYILGAKSSESVGYLAQHAIFDQIPALQKEAPAPDLAVGSSESDLIRLAWIGPAGTVSPLHTDSKENLFVQIVGRKRMQLYSPEDTPSMYPFSKGLLKNTSSLPVSLVTADFLPKKELKSFSERFPLFFSAMCFDVELNPGDMLYLPKGWWHIVQAVDASVSISNWWE